MTNKVTKAQLQAENEVLKQQIEELKNQKTERKFNIFKTTYKNLVRNYIESGEQKNFTINAKYLRDEIFTNKEGEEIKIDGVAKVLHFLSKNGILKTANILKTVDSTGKQVYQIEIEEFDIKGKLQGKFGEYQVFAKDYGNLKLKALA